MPRQLLPFFTCLLLFAGCGERAAPQHGDATADRAGAPDSPPNILLIVVDDMGFTDLGAFGGEIATPNLDALANAGVRFANFHASTMCAPSRAMLLTGVDAHLSGFGNMLEELSPNQKGQPGYEGFLNERVVTVSELLQDAGYRTYVSGKWHLGTEEIARPSARGFDRSFVLASGGASHFADMRPAYAPSPEIRANYWDGDAKLDALPADFEYSSQYYVDRLIADMTADAGADSAQPFFAYLAFTAPHWPIQAPDDAIERHRGRYDDGFDAVAERRLGRLKELGFVAENATRSARSPKEKPFGELDTETRAIEIRAMEIYAAMIDEVDRHTGRLVEFLDDRGLLKNTVVVFLSDNGPEGHDLDETWPADMFPAIRRTIDESHDFSFERMGREGSYTLLGPNWANATSPPFYLHKGFPTEGGTRVPAFIRWPGAAAPSGIRHGLASILDIAPTLLDIAGVEHPGSRYAGRDVEPMTGRSLQGVVDGDSGAERTLGIELLGKRAIRKGRWKLVHMPAPWGNGAWQLFDLDTDLAESRDVAAEHPDVVVELRAAWTQYATDNNVIIPDWVSGY